MRFKIGLGKKDKKPMTGELRDLIYLCLSKSDSEYSQFVHDKGYAFIPANIAEEEVKIWKTFKPFVFSHPWIDKEGNCWFLVGSADTQFVYHFIKGLYMVKEKGLYSITEIVSRVKKPLIVEPEGLVFGRGFTMSPVAIMPRSVELEVGKTVAPDIVEQYLFKVLLQKASAFGKKIENGYFKIEFDDYTIKPGAHKYFRYTLFGDISFGMSLELFNIAYNFGLGIANGLGFGMIELK